MNALWIIVALLIVFIVGSSTGTIMRFERKLSKRDIIDIFLNIPVFAVLGFIIWTKELLKDLIKTKRVRISYVRYIYKSFFRILPSMCEMYAEVIIQKNRIRKKKKIKRSQCGNILFRQNIFNVPKKEYNAVLKNGGIV